MEKRSSDPNKSRRFISDFGETLRNSKENRGLSQRRLARKSGVDHTTIFKLESEDRNPTLLNAVRLAKALRLDPEKELEFYRSALVPKRTILEPESNPPESSFLDVPETTVPISFPRESHSLNAQDPIQRSHLAEITPETIVRRT